MATAWGLGLGMYTRFGRPRGIETLLSAPPELGYGCAAFLLGVAVVGLLEWLLLRRHVERAFLWAPASVAAGAVSVAVVLAFTPSDPDVGWLAGTACFGLAAGVLQWRVLAGRVPRAGWWVVVTTVAWLVGIPLGEELGWNGLGAGYGLLRGTALVWMLRGRR